MSSFFSFRLFSLPMASKNLTFLLFFNPPLWLISMLKRSAKPNFVFLSALFFGSTVWSALLAQQDFSIQYTSQAPIIDGQIQDSAWRWVQKNSASAENFSLNFPQTGMSQWQTQVWLAYDEKYFYLAAQCTESKQKPVVLSLRRDFDFLRNDALGLLIDPFHDGLNGFFFAVSSLGIEAEALVSDGRFLDSSWDMPWRAEVSQTDSGWTAELAIPLSTLRYSATQKSWKINFIRNSMQHNERSTWQIVPLQFDVFSMAFCKEVFFSASAPVPVKNFSLIPYISGLSSQNYTTNSPLKTTSAFGIDAKIPFSASLNLDLTVNPDFSNVEVDQQVTNLERFEIFFPERRQFFVENSDLFARFGFRNIRPFFSRRIGIGFDTVSKTTVQNPILYGGRLSGKINPKTRIGLLHTRTAQDEAAGILGQDYTVFCMQQQVLGRSNLGAIFSQRQSIEASNDPYTRVLGLDYNLQSADNKWWGKFFYHQAFKEKNQSDSYAHASFLNYQTRNWTWAWNHEYIGQNYLINDVGFVRRLGQWRLEPSLRYTHFTPKTKWLNRMSWEIYNSSYYNLTWKPTDHFSGLYYRLTFENQASFSIALTNQFEWLFDRAFDPSNTGGTKLDSGTVYNFQGFEAALASAPRSVWRVGANHRSGGFYNGSRTFWSAWATYRFQPYGSINFSLDYNQINLPEGFRSTQLWLVNTNFSLTFSRKLFLTTFFQYNTQTQNLNHNTRLQWRFRPVSDLFVVFSENYDSQLLHARNRALAIKLTYWLTVNTQKRKAKSS
jgi:hypothetical protein